MVSENQNTTNEVKEPYVGPRPFEENDSDIFFGRDQETNELASLIIAHPIVLVYSQSGAGKTSLLKASLIPLLKARKIEILAPARVKGQDREASEVPDSTNIYVYNALSYLSNNTLSSVERAKISLSDFLPVRTSENRREFVPLRIIIFDQFEEMFTAYPNRYSDRENFFKQINDILKEDSLLRIVIAMREDFIAELDPYSPILPEKLQTRYRLLRLNQESARIAVGMPLEKVNEARINKFVFDLEATDKIVENLRTIYVSDSTEEKQVLSPFIEPVHLQVVCQSLWRKLEPSFKKRLEAGAKEVRITVNDVVEFGNLNQALLEFYEDSLKVALKAVDGDKNNKSSQMVEKNLRKWFDQTLITSEGTRSIVFGNQIDQTVGGIPIAAVRELEKQRLIRAELRGGKIWYELSHDRFIKAIRESNEKWFYDQSIAQIKYNQKSTRVLEKNSILFSNDNEAAIVSTSINNRASEIIKALDLKPYKAVIVIIGSADSIDEKLVPRLTGLFNRGVARAAASVDALIIDGGIQGGIMELMGEGVASRGNKTTLLGVAPENLVTYPTSEKASGAPLDPNHSHFVLVEGNQWGSATTPMFKLVEALTARITNSIDYNLISQSNSYLNEDSSIPRIAILIGGDLIAKSQALIAVRQNLPLLIVKGSGGLADEIADALVTKQAFSDDPVLTEIVADGEMYLHHLEKSVEGMEGLIIRKLGVDKVLMQAWETFATYDLNANIQQKRFNIIQQYIVFLGVIGTGLAISKELFNPTIEYRNLTFFWKFIYSTLILIPVLLLVLIAASNRFKQGSKWLLLRAGAEAIKREIYQYRTRANYYQIDAEQRLLKIIEDITQRITRSEVNSTSLIPYNKENGFPPMMYGAHGGDDGFRYLKPNRYMEVRLGDQLNYFQRKSIRLEKQSSTLYWTTFIVSGIGIFLSATGLQIWIALTISIVTAIGTILSNQQTEKAITNYNQASTDLASIKTWWNSLSSDQQLNQVNIDNLVSHTEEVLETELNGWAPPMRNKLAELHKDEIPKPEREENKEPLEKLIEQKN